MNSKSLVILALCMFFATAYASQINGPSTVFIDGPREISYEIINSALDTKDVEINVYCPQEILCEMRNSPNELSAKESGGFVLFLSPSEESIRKYYMLTIVAKLGDELITKEIKAMVGIPQGPAPAETPTVEQPQTQGTFSIMAVATFLQESTNVLNILLALIAIILLWLLIIKIKEAKSYERKW